MAETTTEEPKPAIEDKSFNGELVDDGIAKDGLRYYSWIDKGVNNG